MARVFGSVIGRQLHSLTDRHENPLLGGAPRRGGRVIRDGKSVSDEFLRACATYLNVPSLLLQRVVGKITVADAKALDAFTGSTLCNAFETARRYATQSAA